MEAAVLPLEGMQVLVVEDDYVTSSEMVLALQEAGATPVGPCPDAVTAMRHILRRHLDCAVVDLNLGRGVEFLISTTLLAGQTPTVFVSACDHASIPAHLAVGATYLPKPVDLAALVTAVARTRQSKRV